MTHTPHELAEEFPELVGQMQRLRETDAHFAKLCDDYHVKNRAVHRAETNIEPTADEYLVEMRKERMALKDQIYAYIRRSEEAGS